MGQGKTVIYFISGITSHLGRELTRQLLAKDSTERIVGISRNEYLQWRMGLEFGDNKKITYRACDVRNERILDHTIDKILSSIYRHQFDLVFIHLASLKHTDLAEDNRLEYQSVIIDGTEVFSRMAHKYKGSLVGISSDKACYPAGTYGGSKLNQEKILLDYEGVVIRPGNLIESHGNIIEKLQRTSPEITCTGMTRFYSHIKDVAEFIIRATNFKTAIFVQKAKSATLGDIVKALKPELLTKETKMFRAGEKMHEHIVTRADYPVYEFDDHYTIGGSFCYDFTGSEAILKTPLRRGFEYCSKDNDKWWTIEEIKEWISRT